MKPALTAVAALVLGLAGFPAAAASPGHGYDDLPADLGRAAIAYDAAQLDKDGAALDALLADDYRLIARGGVILNKAQFVAHSVDPDFKLLPFTVEAPLHTVWSDGAVLGGKVDYRTVDHGKAGSQLLLFADVWARRDGKWRVVYTQVSAASK